MCGCHSTAFSALMRPSTSTGTAAVAREAAARGVTPFMLSRGCPEVQKTAHTQAFAVCGLAGPSEGADGRRDNVADAPGAAGAGSPAVSLRAAARVPAASRHAASCRRRRRCGGSPARASPGLSAAVRGAETLGTQRSPCELELGTRWSRGRHAVAGWRAGREVQKKRT